MCIGLFWQNTWKLTSGGSFLCRAHGNWQCGFQLQFTGILCFSVLPSFGIEGCQWDFQQGAVCGVCKWLLLSSSWLAKRSLRVICFTGVFSVSRDPMLFSAHGVHGIRVVGCSDALQQHVTHYRFIAIRAQLICCTAHGVVVMCCSNGLLTAAT